MPPATPETVAKYLPIVREAIHRGYEGMFRAEGGAFNYPFVAPGSAQYSDVLWDWDSWLSDVALRRTLLECATPEQREEALRYEQGCFLNYLNDGGMDGALHEYYLPENGEPVLNRGFQNWNYLVLNMAAWLEGRETVREF